MFKNKAKPHKIIQNLQENSGVTSISSRVNVPSIITMASKYNDNSKKLKMNYAKYPPKPNNIVLNLNDNSNSNNSNSKLFFESNKTNHHQTSSNNISDVYKMNQNSKLNLNVNDSSNTSGKELNSKQLVLRQGRSNQNDEYKSNEVRHMKNKVSHDLDLMLGKNKNFRHNGSNSFNLTNDSQQQSSFLL